MITLQITPLPRVKPTILPPVTPMATTRTPISPVVLALKTPMATTKPVTTITQTDNNLALLYKTQGKDSEAEPLHKRSLAIREKALGPEHPHVATTLEDYAALLRQWSPRSIRMVGRGFLLVFC